MVMSAASPFGFNPFIPEEENCVSDAVVYGDFFAGKWVGEDSAFCCLVVLGVVG